MAGYRKSKLKGYTNPMAGAEKMPMGDGPMNNAAGKVNKSTESRGDAQSRLVDALKKLRQRRTNMATGRGTDLPTTGGY